MAKKGRSDPGLFGGYTHYDEKGKKIGHSTPRLFGGYTDYDSKGNKIGYSEPKLFGGYNHYDSKGRKTGSSDRGLFGSYNHSDTQGCYIATCVYGSYDCPEVWTLRRFRDNCLAKTRAGRAFIRLYYGISPAIVRRFGGTRPFRSFWRLILNGLLRCLYRCGYDNSPYDDISW